MAKRMISQDIVDSDVFLDMPQSTQLLYFHLAVRADDDGFVSPKKIMRIMGASDDDLKILIGKRYLLAFESGVVVIKHWLIHNLIRADLYKETTYLKEKATLGLNEFGAYTELREGVSELKRIEAPEWLRKRKKDDAVRERTADVPQSARRIGKDRIGKNREESIPDKPESSLEYLKTLPEKDLKEFTYRFDATPKQIQSKAEDLLNYCQAKGKKYKNYRAFLINALKKDFKEMTEDERKRRQELHERVQATRETIEKPKALQSSIDALKSKMTLKRG